MALTSAIAVSLSQGCAPSGWFRNPFPSVTAEMQVTRLNAPGRYQVSGTTGLPDATPMGVAAVRYLNLTNPVASNPTGRRIYSLLDYQVIEVSDGIWQTELDLWQVDADGQFREDWQAYSDRLDLSVVPDDEVIFLSIPTPTRELAQLERRLQNRQQRLDEALLRQTLEGERYAELAYVDRVPLPVGGTDRPPQGPQDINGGWGRRYLLQPESPNPNELEKPSDRRTTAPPTADEFLQ